LSKRSEGSAPHRWRGRWRARVTIGYDDKGNQVRRDVYGKNEQECYDRWMALRRDLTQGQTAAEADMSVLEWFNLWISNKAVKARTREEYTFNSRHLFANLPKRGREKLKELRVVDVHNMQQSVNTKVSARAAVKTRALLHNMLDDAMKLELITRNVTALVDPVRYRAEEFKIWTAPEVDRFLRVALRTEYYPIYYTALTTGMRPGELIALHWEDVQGNKIRVHRGVSVVDNKPILSDVKTLRGNRVLTIPEDTQAVLEEHQSYVPSGTKLVFPSRAGTFLGHRNIRRNIHTQASRADVPAIRFHDMRHTYASMRIADGADPLRLSRELGHHSPGFTLQRYGHIFDRYREHEAPTLARLLGRIEDVDDENDE
jgi:integrase